MTSHNTSFTKSNMSTSEAETSPKQHSPKQLQPPDNHDHVQARIENIIYNIYIQEKAIDSPKSLIGPAKSPPETMEEKKQSSYLGLWEELRKEFNIGMAGTIKQLYTNQSLILHVVRYLMGLPFTDSSKRIIKNIVEYYDPSRTFIKLLIGPLVPTLEKQQQSELNKINVILYTLNVLFMQQSPENSKFNQYIYLNGGEGLKLQSTTKWPFEKGGTICLWYNMSEQTKECKLFEITNAEKADFEIVLRDKKIYFQRLKEKSGFRRLIRNDSYFLCEAEAKIDVKLWIEFEIKKNLFNKPYFFLNVVMNNFVLHNIEVDYFNSVSAHCNVNLFRNFRGKISSVLIFTHNLANEVENLNSKQGFTYENDIKNFSYMFENLLSHVFLLYTAIRAKTIYQDDPNESFPLQSESEQAKKEKQIFDRQIPVRTVVFDAINRRNGVIGAEACVYRNISIHKKQMVLYGGLQSYVGFFDLLKFHSRIIEKDNCLYSQTVSELILLFKNIFESKATSIEQAESMCLFHLMSNFFIETEMKGFSEELIPKLKELYVSLNNRCIKQKFIKQLIWGIPAGQFLELGQLQLYVNLVKGLYVEQIQNSLNVFGVKDIINFLLDRYDRINCCFDHTRSNSIDSEVKIRKYPQVLAEYFKIVEKILFIKRLDVDIGSIVHQIIACFALNVSPCFVEAVVKFLSDIFAKDSLIEKIFLQQFETCYQAKMGLFSALANSYSWRTKGNLIELILHIFGIKMFKEGGEKDLMALCIRYPTLTVRFSSVKSNDIDRSVDVSEDKVSLNSTNVRSFMAMRPLHTEELMLLHDEEIIRIIWQWGTSKDVMQSKLQDNENPATIILMDLYKGSSYKLRKMMTQLLLSNIALILFTPDFVAWVIECLLICEFDAANVVNSDEILFQLVVGAKQNLLKLISTYRVGSTEEEDSVENQLNIIKLILISVKSKYSAEISKLNHIVFLLISQELINSFYEEVRAEKFQSQQDYQKKMKHVLSNCYRCILEYFIFRGNDDFEFEEQSEMAENEREYALLLSILERIFDILDFTTSNNAALLDEANAKRNQLIFQLLFPAQGKASQICLLCFTFVCLQGLFDNYDDIANVSEKKLILTLIKKYLFFLIEISENNGALKMESFEQTLRHIFLNTLGFLQSKFYQYYFMESSMQVPVFKNCEDIKDLIVNIFLELIQFMKRIEDCSCLKYKPSFYELMNPKRKHKNISSIKSNFPAFWRGVDDKIREFIEIKTELLRQEDARNCLEEHLKMKRLYMHTVSIEKLITKSIDQLLQNQKKTNEVTERNSIFCYLRNQTEKCKTLTEFQENIAIFMYQNSSRQRNQEQQRKVQNQAIRRRVLNVYKGIWNYNRTYEGLWANVCLYGYSQNRDSFLYDNTLNMYYTRVRSDRQSKYLLSPFIGIEAREIGEGNEDRWREEQVFKVQAAEEEGQKIMLERRKSQKYLQVGFQFLKKKVIEKIKKSAILMKELSQEDNQKKTEQSYFKEVLLIEPMQVHTGTLKIDGNWLEFQYRPSSHLQHISLSKNRQKPTDLLAVHWPLHQIEACQFKRYMLRQTAIEIYFRDRRSVFLSFYGRAEQNFQKFVDLLQCYRKTDVNLQKIPYALKLLDPSRQADKYLVTEQWRNRQMSNFNYLMSLNMLSGRSNCDLNQYFILPWIMASYTSAKFKRDDSKYRDLQRNMGNLGSSERIQKFIDIKNAIELNHKEEFVQSHFFGFHYSNLPIVLQYMVRLNPYADGNRQLQGGKFDIPDRLFISLADSFRNATSEMSDVRQLIPEFYYLPEFLINCEEFDFGVQQNGKRVNNVELPDGYANAYDFIEAHRQQLESEEVSLNLHKWIDLVFGYKQCGREAELAFNKFHYLSYEGNAVSIFHEDKIENKESIESQIAYFGKVPSQIFTKPHPRRNALSSSNLSEYSQGYTRANPFVNQQPIDPLTDQQLIRHTEGVFSLPNQACVHFKYCELNKKYVVLLRDGRGLVFQNDRSQYGKEVTHQRYLSISSPLHFQLLMDKYEHVYIFDETLDLQALPICSMWSEHLFVGGLWGGKILKRDIVTKQVEMHCKHSDTVTAMACSEQLQVLVSGAVNGELVIWEYVVLSNSGTSNVVGSYAHTSRKLIFKSKLVAHSQKINAITISNDLRVAVCSSQDGLLSVVDVERFEVIRVIQINEPIKNALVVSFPYYMFFISCADHQYCYSLNGQYLDESHYEQLHRQVAVCTINGYQQRIVVKKKEEACFSLLKLPQLREEVKIQIKNEDNNVLEYCALGNNIDIEILFYTPTHLVYCNNTILSNLGKGKALKKGKE